MRDDAIQMDAEPGERIDLFLLRAMFAASWHQKPVKATHNGVTTRVYAESDKRDVFEKHDLALSLRAVTA